MKKDTISESLGMVPYFPDPLDIKEIKHDVIDTHEQFEEIKTNLRQLLAKTTPALNNLIDVASTAESDKMFLALAALLKSITEANRELADTTVKQSAANGDRNPTTINNNLNITAADLLKMIKKESND